MVSNWTGQFQSRERTNSKPKSDTMYRFSKTGSSIRRKL